MTNLILADIAEISSPLTLRGPFEENLDGNIRLLSIRDLVSMNPFDPQRLQLIKADVPASRTNITTKDILMPARGQNYPARIVPSFQGLILPTGQVHIIRARSVHPLYLLWYLNRLSTQDQIAAKLTGSTIQSLRKSDLQRLEVIIPPIHVQEIIGDLYQLDLQREISRKELAHIEAQEMSAICESAINQ